MNSAGLGKSRLVGRCEKRSQFAAEVIEVGLRQWLVKEFFNDGQEVMQ